MIRSGVNSRDVELKKRIALTDFRSIKEIVAEACPVPNERTVQRLKDAYKSYNFSIRPPWQSAPAPRYYDEQDVLFYARILTMLAALDIYPPAQVQAAGGGTTSILPTTIDGPLTFVPEGQSSGRSLRIPQTEDEAKEIALSRNQGGLADAAEGQLPVLQNDAARSVVMAAIDEYEGLPPELFEPTYPMSMSPDQITTKTQYAVFLEELDGFYNRQMAEFDRLGIRRREFFAEIDKKWDEIEARMRAKREQAEQELSIFDHVDDDEFSEKAKQEEAKWKDVRNQIEIAEMEIALLEDRIRELEWQEEMLKMRYPVVVYQTPEQKTAPFRRRFERLRNWARSLFVRAPPQPVAVPPSPEDEKVPYTTLEEKENTWRTIAGLAYGIRRRLRRSRLTMDEKYEVIELLPPVEHKNDIDEDDDFAEDEFYPATVRYMEDLPEAERQDRVYLIKKIARYLLLPITGSAVAGIALHKNLNSTPNDPLIDLFLALPKNSWFRELPFRCWAHIITLTPREENFLLLQQVAANVLHYQIDVYNLWQIDRLMFDLRDRDIQIALAWFQIVKADVNYRARNAKELSKLIDAVEKDQNKLLSSYAACYICGANERALNVLASYYSARPPIKPTSELTSAAQEAQNEVMEEYVQYVRTRVFVSLLHAFSNVIANTPNYDAPWLRDVRILYSYSTFRDVVKETAFNNFLHEIAVRSMHYSTDAKEVVEDFIRRYTDRDSDKLKFQSLEQSLASEKDIFGPTKQLLQAMREYRNDQKMDQLSYDFLNMRWDKHSGQVEHKNFADAIQYFNLTKNEKMALFSVIGALDSGVVTFLDRVHKDLAGADDFPLTLPSVGLTHVGDVTTGRLGLNDSSSRVQEGPSRRLLSQPPDVTNIPFIRTARYVLMPIGVVSFMIVTEEEDGRKYMNLASLKEGTRTLPDKDGKVDEDVPSHMELELWRKPVETSDVGQYTLPSPQEWDMRVFGVTASVSAVFIVDVLTDSQFSQFVIPLSASYFSSVASYAWDYGSRLFGQSFQAFLGANTATQVGVVGGATLGGITAVYGTEAVKTAIVDGVTSIFDVTSTVVEKVQSTVTSMGSILVLGAGAVLVMYSLGPSELKRALGPSALKRALGPSALKRATKRALGPSALKRATKRQ